MRQQVFDVLTIGETLRDILCILRTDAAGILFDRDRQALVVKTQEHHQAKAFHMSLGGGAANAAVACARLGIHVGIVSATGRDEVGEALVQELKKERVDTSLLMNVSLEQTGINIILLDERTGEQTNLCVPSASRLVEITEDVQKTLHTTRWVYLQTLGDTLEENQQFLLSALAKEETHLAFVPSSREIRAGAQTFSALLSRATLCSVSAHDAPVFLGDRTLTVSTPEALAARLRDNGPTIAVITESHGAATIITEQETITVPPPTAAVAHITGLEDAFAATFVAGLHLYDGDAVQAAQAAAVNVASVVSAHTVQHGLLTRSVLEERVRRSGIQLRREGRR